jgi:hypothetical protein
MLRAYRLIYLQSPEAPPTLWEWEQPYIHHLIVNTRSFHTTQVAQRYFRCWDDLAQANARIWEAHYRPRPIYDVIETWRQWLDAYRQLILEVQDIYEI